MCKAWSWSLEIVVEESFCEVGAVGSGWQETLRAKAPRPLCAWEVRGVGACGWQGVARWQGVAPGGSGKNMARGREGYGL